LIVKHSVSGRNEAIHGQDCGHDEAGETLRLSGWTYHFISGKVSKYFTQLWLHSCVIVRLTILYRRCFLFFWL